MAGRRYIYNSRGEDGSKRIICLEKSWWILWFFWQARKDDNFFFLSKVELIQGWQIEDEINLGRTPKLMTYENITF